MGVVRCWGMKRCRLSCGGVGGCKRASMTGEIASDNQDAIRYIWPPQGPHRLMVSDRTQSCAEGQYLSCSATVGVDVCWWRSPLLQKGSQNKPRLVLDDYEERMLCASEKIRNITVRSTILKTVVHQR